MGDHALYAPLLEGLPELARVHRLGPRRLRRRWNLAVTLRGRFDLAINLQNKVKSAVVARAAAPQLVCSGGGPEGQSARLLG